MRVLVAGASGALGVPLTLALLAAGHGVTCLSRTPANRQRLRALGAETLIADAMDRAALLAASPTERQISGRTAFTPPRTSTSRLTS